MKKTQMKSVENNKNNIFKEANNSISERMFYGCTGDFIDVEIKTALSPIDAKEFINFVESNCIDEDGNYITFEKEFSYNIALVKYYTNITELYKDITKEEVWNLIYNSNILELLESHINKYQIKLINNTLDKYEEIIIGSAIRSQNNVSENLVSSFAGIGYEIQDIIMRLQDYLDAFEKQVMDKDGNVDFQPVLSAVSTLNSVDKESAIRDVIKQFLTNKTTQEESMKVSDESDGSSN